MNVKSTERPFDGMRLSLAGVIAFSIATGPVAAAAANSLEPQTPANYIGKTSLTERERVEQAISRLTFGARPGDLDRVSKMGVDAFIMQQLDPDSIDDSALSARLSKLPTLMLSTPTIAAQYNPPPPPKPLPTPSPSPAVVNAAKTVAADIKATDAKPETSMATAGQNGGVEMQKPSPTPAPAAKPTPTPKNPYQVVVELQRAKLLRAVYSERQLNEVMVDFWENHFSIYANKDSDRLLLTAFDRDSVRPYAMGRFRDLLGAVAHSPAMMYYLDNWQSTLAHDYPATKDRPARHTGGINENYARELMELHTLGVDGGYTQKDVQEVARCFTGWTIRKPNEEGTFLFNPAVHDNGEKVVLGVRIPAGGGIADGERVLDILAKSPATAHFVAKKLARRFLGDNPSQATIDRVAAVYLRTDGSISEMLKCIIQSKEFFNPATFQTKVKSPFEYVASAIRITGAETDANSPILGWISRMGEPIYGRVTPDGYPDVTTEWLSNNDFLSRLNFASALVMNRIKGTTVDAEKLIDTRDPGKMPAEVIDAFLMRDASDQTRQALEKLAAGTSSPAPSAQPPPTAVKWAPDAAKPDEHKAVTAELVAMALGSPEFQRK